MNISSSTLSPLVLASALVLGLFSHTASAQQAPPSGDAYWDMSSNSAPKDLSRSDVMSSGMSNWSQDDTIESGRAQMIQVAAASLGSQAASAARSREIQSALMARARQYDLVFDFSKIMLEPGFLPPVITEGRDAYSQPNDVEARASDRIFKIERPARIVSIFPTWRTYLLAQASPAARPDMSVLPKSASEKRLWDEWAARGWEQGARLADANFEASLARLRQDFEGMLRFKMLYEQGLVSMPRLARTNMGVTGGGDEMAINDRIIRITERAALDANTRNWNTRAPQTNSRDH